MKKLLFFLLFVLSILSIFNNTYANNPPILGSVNTPNYVNSNNESNFPIFLKGIEDTDLSQELEVEYSYDIGNTWTTLPLTISTPVTDTAVYFELDLSSEVEGINSIIFRLTDGTDISNEITANFQKDTIVPSTPTSLIINGGDLFTNTSSVSIDVSHPDESDVFRWCISSTNNPLSCNWVSVKPTIGDLLTPITNSCSSRKPFCEIFGGCTLTEGSPITSNQAWNKDSGSCSYSCNDNFSGDKCEIYEPLSCSSTLPDCSANGTCDLFFSPTQINQSWLENSNSCGFVCHDGYDVSGSDCVPAEPQTVGETDTLTFNIGGTNYDYSVKRMPDNRLWTTQNMRHNVASDGTSITRDCYGNNTSNCDTDGGLYTWTSAMGTTGTTENYSKSVCGALGTGWRLPSHQDWFNLESSLGCTNTNTGVWTCSPLGWTGNKYNGLMSYLPGFRSTDGSYFSRGSSGYWWSSTQSDSSSAWYRVLNLSYSEVLRNANSKAYGFSVVCVKD